MSILAVAYFVCFLIMQLRFRYQVVAGVALLALHTSLFFLFPGPDGPFTKTGNIGAVWDRALMGYNYASWTTNLNIVSTTVSALFGVWAGTLLRGVPGALPGNRSGRLAQTRIPAGGRRIERHLPLLARNPPAPLVHPGGRSLHGELLVSRS